MQKDWKTAAGWLTARSPRSSVYVSSAELGTLSEDVEVATLQGRVRRVVGLVEDEARESSFAALRGPA